MITFSDDFRRKYWALDRLVVRGVLRLFMDELKPDENLTLTMQGNRIFLLVANGLDTPLLCVGLEEDCKPHSQFTFLAVGHWYKFCKSHWDNAIVNDLEKFNKANGYD